MRTKYLTIYLDANELFRLLKKKIRKLKQYFNESLGSYLKNPKKQIWRPYYEKSSEEGQKPTPSLKESTLALQY